MWWQSSRRVQLSAPVDCNLVMSKCIVSLLNDCNAAVIGHGHRGATRCVIVEGGGGGEGASEGIVHEQLSRLGR